MPHRDEKAIRQELEESRAQYEAAKERYEKAKAVAMQAVTEEFERWRAGITLLTRGELDNL